MKRIGMANILTIFRIACIPIFVLFYALEFYVVALIVFTLAGFTDLIDGTIARLRKENSNLGALLDPAADKGLMLAVFIALAITKVVPWWFVYIILFRDIVVISGFIFVKIRNIKFNYKALFTSKVATLLEIVAGLLALIYKAYPLTTIWVYPIGDMLFGTVFIASILILVASIQYLKLGLELLDRNSKKSLSHG